MGRGHILILGGLSPLTALPGSNLITRFERRQFDKSFFPVYNPCKSSGG